MPKNLFPIVSIDRNSIGKKGEENWIITQEKKKKICEEKGRG